METWNRYRLQAARRNAKIVAAYHRGVKAADLAKRYRISRQRIEQIVSAAR